MTDLISTHVEDFVCTLKVCRSRVSNALNEVVLKELLEAITALSNDSRVRTIILTGEGEHAFIAGADINEFENITPSQAIAWVRRLRQVTHALVSSPKVVIASIQGHCLGGGLELALACDLRIASTAATFGLPEIKLGIIPGGGGTVRLTQAVGGSIARQMSMTGETITATRAAQIGLIYSTHSPPELVRATKGLALKMAGRPPFAIDQLKTVLDIAASGASTEVALEAEIKAFALCFSTQDQSEGVEAFLQKRKPEFTGR